MDSTLQALQERVRAAAAAKTPLTVAGGGTKEFYGNAPRGEMLDVRPVSGIVDYEPTELVVTVRGGTPLARTRGSRSPSRTRCCRSSRRTSVPRPPSAAASPPASPVRARMTAGARARLRARRDACSTAAATCCRFGGRVMKNVAGYDVSRTLAGSLGTLGVLVEVSLKVLPRPVAEPTLLFELNEAESIRRVNEWGGQPLPISATAWRDGQLYVRLSGARGRGAGGAREDGWQPVPEAALLWAELREQSHVFFAAGAAHAVAPGRPADHRPARLCGATLIEWDGAQRWRVRRMRRRRRSARGPGPPAATRRCSGGGDRRSAFHPLPPALAAIHRRLKAEFDPAGIFNPGRMYPEI